MLGAETILTSNFEPRCTHVILNKPQRNEKFLCALVRGLWLLDTSYVKSSVQSNSLLPEEKYEWGNPKATHIATTNPSIQTYASAAYRRRVAVQNGNGCNPFSDWRVILALPKDKVESMRRILEMGGASIVSCSELPADLSVVTHVFIDSKKSGLKREEIQSLLASEAKCLKAEYIPAYLVNDSSFDETKLKFELPPERASRNESNFRLADLHEGLLLEADMSLASHSALFYITLRNVFSNTGMQCSF
ncbi:hypothetical protein EB796_005624 [Bugula neritina]|uniref:BRCT domain-containing protein n=1 Tax=Bugula neritina TaxID=10212 RepID=A0A7J7KDX6_BUGNE|nr:hypothetical protein EB796_005624 [Bugula neritina]